MSRRRYSKSAGLQRANEDLQYFDGRAPGNEVRRDSRVCLHNGGKRLHGNIFRCMRCNKPMGFLRAPKTKERP